MVGTEKSRRVTAKVAQLMRGSCRDARCPSRAAVVIPPAQSDTVLAWSVPVISVAARMASSTAST